MSIITTLFKCLTCSLGPRIWKRIKKKTNFSHWPLRRQVVVAASLQLFCVLILFLITMGLFVHLIYSSSQKKLEEELTLKMDYYFRTRCTDVILSIQ